LNPKGPKYHWSRYSLSLLLIIFLTPFAVLLSVSPPAHAQSSVISTIPVGPHPWGITYDSAKQYVYFTNGDDVSVISDSAKTVIQNITLGSSPLYVVYDSLRGYVYVSDWSTSTVSVISDAHNQVIANIDLGAGTQAGALAFDSSNGEVYVSDGENLSISVISDATNTIVGSIGFPLPPPGGGCLEPYSVGYVSSLVYDSSKGYIYAAVNAENLVDVISDTTNNVIQQICVGENAFGLAYDSARGYVYVTDQEGNLGTNGADGGAVSVISDATNTVIQTISVGRDPLGLAYDSANGMVYVADGNGGSGAYVGGGNTVYVIADSTNSVVQGVNVGSEPSWVAYDGNGFIYVTNGGSNTVSVISDGTSTTIATSALATTSSTSNTSVSSTSFSTSAPPVTVATTISYSPVSASATGSISISMTVPKWPSGEFESAILSFVVPGTLLAFFYGASRISQSSKRRP